MWLCGLTAVLVSISLGSEARGAPSLEISRVTLQGKLPLSAAIKRLEAGGNRVVDLRARLGQEVVDPELTLDVVNMPFWEALDAVARQAQLRVAPHVDAKTGEPVVGVLAAGGPGVQPPIRYAGPFRIVIRQMTGTRNLEDPNQGSLSCVVQVACEPRLQPLLLKMGRSSLKVRARSEEANLLELGSIGTIKMLGEAAIEIPLRLPLPPRELKTLAELRGEFTALTPPRNLTFELPRLTISEKATQEGVTVTLSSFQVDRTTRQWHCGLTLAYPPGSLDLESHQTWALERNKVWLRHKQSRKLVETKLNPEIGIDEGRAIHINYTFADVPGTPEDWELVYAAPAPPVAFPVRFVFTDLPLP